MHHSVLKDRWAAKWRTSGRGKRDAYYDKATPLKKLLKMINQKKLNCKDSSHIAQLSHQITN